MFHLFLLYAVFVHVASSSDRYLVDAENAHEHGDNDQAHDQTHKQNEHGLKKTYKAFD
jgi:hypothetical protein